MRVYVHIVVWVYEDLAASETVGPFWTEDLATEWLAKFLKKATSLEGIPGLRLSARTQEEHGAIPTPDSFLKDLKFRLESKKQKVWPTRR